MQKILFPVKITFFFIIAAVLIFASSGCCFGPGADTDDSTDSAIDSKIEEFARQDLEKTISEASQVQKGWIKDGNDKVVWQTSALMEIKISQNGIENDYLEAGKPVLFSFAGTLLDYPKEDLLIEWDLGNGEKETRNQFDYIFEEPGVYTVSLTASSGSSSDTAIATIWVAEFDGNFIITGRYNCIVEAETIIKNNGPGNLSDVTFEIDVPMTLLPFQEVNSVSAGERDFSPKNDESGDLFYRFDLGKIAEGEEESVLVESDISIIDFAVRRDIDVPDNYDEQDLNKEDFKKYLESGKYIDADSDIIKNLAAGVAGDESNPLLIAEKLYNYVAENMEYDWDRFSLFERELYRASEILNLRKGVCEDYAILYAALCRASGIPVKYINGLGLQYILTQDDNEFETGHAWNEIYLPAYGWVPVDPTSESPFLSDNISLNLKTMDDIRPDNIGFNWIYYDTEPSVDTWYYYRVKGLEESIVPAISLKEYQDFLEEVQ